MDGLSDATRKMGLTIDRGARTIRFERSFAAPPNAVFEAWTTPDHVACWWDPDGVPLAECEIDLRPGGAFRFVSLAHSEMPFTGVYRLISPPERLEFDAMGAAGRVMLERDGEGTLMIVEIECPSTDHFDHFLKVGVHEGTARTLDNLVAYLAPRSR
jgi:uncharacterized protein YndB with AHSA1/START domain